MLIQESNYLNRAIAQAVVQQVAYGGFSMQHCVHQNQQKLILHILIRHLSALLTPSQTDVGLAELNVQVINMLTTPEKKNSGNV